jgi:hypothetical protein
MIRSVPTLPAPIQLFAITDNDVETIEQQQPKLQDLGWLYLGGNQLSEFPKFGMAELTEYCLMSNNFATIRRGFISTKAVRIDLSDNRLASIPPFFFGLQNLRFLSLARNQIHRISTDIRNCELVMLDLSGNPLEHFPWPLPPTLERLFLEDCGLTAVSADIVDMPELIELNVARNSIVKLPRIQSLLSLNISHNKLGSFPKLPATIVRVDVSMNAITKLPRRLTFQDLQYLDISFNRIGNMPGLLSLPSLRNFKFASCKLRGTLDFAAVPQILFMDAARSRADFANVIEESSKLILTTRHGPASSPAFQRISVHSFVAYALCKGESEIIDDVPLIKHYQGTGFYGLFDSRAGRTSIKVLRAAAEAASFCAESDEASFSQVVSSVMAVYKDEQLYDNADFLVFMKLENVLHIASLGLMDLVAVHRSRRRLAFLTRPEIDPRRHFRNGLEGHLLSSISVGDRLVYGKVLEPEVRTTSIDAHDRFLIALSAAAMAALTEASLLSVCAAATSARDLAYLVKARASVGTKENISILVIDLKPEDDSGSSESGTVVQQTTTSSEEEREEPVKARPMERHMTTGRSSDSLSSGPEERRFDDPQRDEPDDDFPAFPATTHKSGDELTGPDKFDGVPDDDLSFAGAVDP